VLYGIAYDTVMIGPSIAIDTCVLVSALRSRRGAAHRLVRRIGTGQFELALSLSLMLEYEDVCKRLIGTIPLSEAEIDDILDFLAKAGREHTVHYLWRPALKDPADDMVLELAVAANCQSIVTFNIRDFAGAERFGPRVETPRDFLNRLENEP
jgi:putative PIN family toxin of toxin-antitoxin system